MTDGVMRRVVSRTPYRISFFGGGTDYPAWSREHGGAVLSATIDRYCHVSVRNMPPWFPFKHRAVYSKIEDVLHEQDFRHPAVREVLRFLEPRMGLEICHEGDLPARTGIGSSSSFTVGLIRAVAEHMGLALTRAEIARMAITVEQERIGENVGCQDQVAAAFGGLNVIQFQRDGTFGVVPVMIDGVRLGLLEERLLLVFTGLARTASEVAQATIDAAGQSCHEMTLSGMRAMVYQARELLQGEGDDDVLLDEFGRLLDEAWQMKRGLSERISNVAVDDIYARARKAGASGGKLLGAGGGGFVLLCAPPDAHAAIRAALAGLIMVPVRFERLGTHLVEHRLVEEAA